MKREFCIKGIYLGISLLLFLSCSKKSSVANPYPSGTGNNGNTVTISNMSFASSSISVAKGTTVTWTNNDAMQHTVTADDNSFTSAKLNYGDTYSHMFSDAGTIAYHCTVHPSMTGTVEVK
jgi:plastocyanin